MLSSREPGNPVRRQQIATGAPVDISGKADTAAVDAAMASKADASTVDSIDGRVSTLEAQVADLLSRVAVIEAALP